MKTSLFKKRKTKRKRTIDMASKAQLTAPELARYARHLTIPEFGMAAQLKLKNARVLVIGSGGLGSPMLLYLAAAGVGKIGIVDFDRVDDSNLQRQVLFNVHDIGKAKAQTAKEKIAALNPHIEIEVYETDFNRNNARQLVRQYDVVADGTDNFPTRYLVNDACVLENKVNVYASIFQFEGQVSVFNYLFENGERGPNYRDLFPEPPPPGLVPNCAEGGVLGVLPGIIGSMQANEVIKVVTGVGESLAGRFFLFDAASFTTRILKVKKRPDTQITELIDYDIFCGIKPTSEMKPVKEATVKELHELKSQNADFQLIDVREPHEVDIAEIGGELIPLATVAAAADRISRDKKVIVHCRTGVRSANAIRELEDKFGFENLYNLKGGIRAWSEEIDPAVPVY